MSHLRLVAFAAIVLAAIWAYLATPQTTLAARIAFALSIAAFAALVALHRKAQQAHVALDQRHRYFQLGIHRLARDWASLPATRLPQPAAHQPYATDLDITGHASLFRLMDVVSAAPARPVLLQWLLGEPPSTAEILERQRGARELADRDDLRAELGVAARASGELNPAALEDFLAWCEHGTWTAAQPTVVWLGRVITLATVVVLFLQVIGVMHHAYWLFGVLVGRAVGPYLRRHVGEAARLPSLPLRALRAHRLMFAQIVTAPLESPMLDTLRSRLAQNGRADVQLARLERISAWADVRYSPMMHFALDWLLLWDLHVAIALDGWRRAAGRSMREWMAALAQIESLAALGTLAYDHPDWTFPEIDASDTRTVIEATALGHPLLPSDRRVTNDVVVGPPGTFLLITGSNMSGKSTLLRAIGTNVVLAQAGGPVCANRYRGPVCSVRTSIRIEDSLADGVSLFMAELRRLKSIVDAARERPGGRPVLYLLDEILHGTNSAERRVAARTVIGHLLQAGAIGAVTTHDLSLASDGSIATAARPVSFGETVDRTSGAPVLHFDYRLRPGLATSTNALALLEIVGLGDTSPR